MFTTCIAHMNQKEGFNPLGLALVGFKTPYGSWEPNLVLSARTSAVKSGLSLYSPPFLIKIVKFYMYEIFVHVYIYVPCVCPVPAKIRREHLVSGIGV